MNPLISSGDAKITSARSPIIPAPTRAGAPFCGPSSLTSVLKRKLRSQKSRVTAMIDQPHPLLRSERLEVGYRAAAHHHAAHPTAVLRGLGRAAELRGLFEEREQIGTLPRI